MFQLIMSLLLAVSTASAEGKASNMGDPVPGGDPAIVSIEWHDAALCGEGNCYIALLISPDEFMLYGTGDWTIEVFR